MISQVKISGDFTRTMETVSTLIKFRLLLKKWRENNFCSHMLKPENMSVYITDVDVCINRAIFSGLLQIKCSSKLE